MGSVFYPFCLGFCGPKKTCPFQRRHNRRSLGASKQGHLWEVPEGCEAQSRLSELYLRGPDLLSLGIQLPSKKVAVWGVFRRFLRTFSEACGSWIPRVVP